jgi:hypothetical protein
VQAELRRDADLSGAVSQIPNACSALRDDRDGVLAFGSALADISACEEVFCRSYAARWVTASEKYADLNLGLVNLSVEHALILYWHSLKTDLLLHNLRRIGVPATISGCVVDLG